MIAAGHPVKVTAVVHPGGIKTAIARNMTTVEGFDKEELARTFDKKLATASPQRRRRSSSTASARTGPGSWSAPMPRRSTSSCG